MLKGIVVQIGPDGGRQGRKLQRLSLAVVPRDPAEMLQGRNSFEQRLNQDDLRMDMAAVIQPKLHQKQKKKKGNFTLVSLS